MDKRSLPYRRKAAEAASNFHLRFARQTEQGWQQENVWTINEVRSVEMAVDQSGQPAIAFKDRNQLGAIVARPSTAPAVSYATWIESFNLTGADAVASADPDHDTLSNLLEFAFRLNPELPDATSLTPATGTKGIPTIHQSTGAVIYEWIERISDELTYTLQSSETLSNTEWNAHSEGTITESIDANWQRKKAPLPMATERRFWRLETSFTDLRR